MTDKLISPLSKRLFEIDNDLDRFDFLALLALNSPAFPDELKTEEHRLPACETKTWYALNYDGAVRLSFESDSLFVKGLCAVLSEIVSLGDVETLASGIGFADECYERKIINDARRLGLSSLEEKIKTYTKTIIKEKQNEKSN